MLGLGIVLSLSIRVTVTVPADPAAPLRVAYEGDFGASATRRVRAAPAVVGAYERFPFGRFFRDVDARDADGRSLPVTRGGEGLWTVEGPLARLAWEVDTASGERELSDFLVSTHRRKGYALLSGPATFLLVEGAEDRPYEVAFRLPEGWRLESALADREGEPCRARNALELLDEPVALGGFHVATATDAESGVACVLVDPALSADAEGLAGRFLQANRRALAAAAALEVPVPQPRFLAILEVVPPVAGREFGWALEHGRSFHGAFAAAEVPDDPLRLAYHFAHHAFHAWLPRRLHTDRLHPRRQLEGEPSEFVWFAEGFAQYLAFVGLARAGVMDSEEALERMARRFVPAYLENAPPQPRSMTAHSLSLCAGDKTHWRRGYAQGALLALWLEEALQEAAEPAPTLCEVLLRLHRRSAPEGLPEDRFEDLFREASGLDVSEIFRRHVRGAEPLPLDEILRSAGVVREGEAFRALPLASLGDAARRFRERVFGERAAPPRPPPAGR